MVLSVEETDDSGTQVSKVLTVKVTFSKVTLQLHSVAGYIHSEVICSILMIKY